MYITFYESPVGPIKIAGNENAITNISFVEKTETGTGNEITRKCADQLGQYFDGTLTVFNVPLEPAGTDFQKQVWNELLKIPYGKTISYGKLSENIKNKNAVRAVGKANGLNPVPIIIPCHRVIGNDGSLVGYAGGLERKKWLLQHEARVSGFSLF